MRIGIAILSAAALLAGCSTGGKLDIRPVGKLDSKGDHLALGAGELAMGNVGLALGSFRRALRDDPASTDALAGIAACYDRMGRHDLSRRAFEQALAIAPSEGTLYQSLASSLDRQGLVAEAASVRREAASRLAATAAPVVTTAGSVAVLPQLVAAAPSAASVTVALAPPRAAEPVRPGARLERLSSGEVALLTSPRSPWQARVVAVSPRTAVVRFELRDSLLVLNGARVAGLAARTRAYLAERGFAGARIGDAPATTPRTTIRFAPAERERALRIAAQFPSVTAVSVASGPLTLVVGGDAPRALLRG